MAESVKSQTQSYFRIYRTICRRPNVIVAASETIHTCIDTHYTCRYSLLRLLRAARRCPFNKFIFHCAFRGQLNKSNKFRNESWILPIFPSHFRALFLHQQTHDYGKCILICGALFTVEFECTYRLRLCYI